MAFLIPKPTTIQAAGQRPRARSVRPAPLDQIMKFSERLAGLDLLVAPQRTIARLLENLLSDSPLIVGNLANRACSVVDGFAKGGEALVVVTASPLGSATFGPFTNALAADSRSVIGERRPQAHPG
jgi:hypothetical protein